MDKVVIILDLMYLQFYHIQTVNLDKIILYCADNSSSAHANNTNKDILILGKDSADELNKIRIGTE